MTEKKRFQVHKVIGSFLEWSIEDTIDDKIVFKSIIHKYEADRLCAKLNELSEQADAVRTELQLCEEENTELQEENEQLKQFKEDVFAKIDMHLRMLPTARDNEFNEENGDPSLYTGAIYMLETLKKELQE